MEIQCYKCNVTSATISSLLSEIVWTLFHNFIEKEANFTLVKSGYVKGYVPYLLDCDLTANLITLLESQEI